VTAPRLQNPCKCQSLSTCLHMNTLQPASKELPPAAVCGAVALSCCLQDAFAPIALKTIKELIAMLPAAGSDLDRLRAVLSALRLCCRIFYSLNAPGLTPVGAGC